MLENRAIFYWAVSRVAYLVSAGCLWWVACSFGTLYSLGFIGVLSALCAREMAIRANLIQAEIYWRDQNPVEQKLPNSDNVKNFPNPS